MAATQLSELQIEAMRLRDVSQVLRIERASFPTPWSRRAFLSELLTNENAHYIVARIGKRVVGYVGMWLVAGEAHVTNLAVHPKYRRRGIGRKLMDHLARMAREKGAIYMTLEVRRSNLTAQSLYRQLGFVVEGVRPGYYLDNGEDALLMGKDLLSETTR